MKVVDPADCLTDTAVADTERMMWSMNLDVVHWRPADWPRSAGGGGVAGRGAKCPEGDLYDGIALRRSAERVEWTHGTNAKDAA